MQQAPRPGRGAAGKAAKPNPGPTTSKDWHTAHGHLLLKSEKAIDSLERMLSVCRTVCAFLTHLLRPSSRYADTPCVILGQHYLSHRELGVLHRGDLTRIYLQELSSYDTVEAPIPAAKYFNAGHVDVAKLKLSCVPVSHARMRKEGIMGTSGQPYIEVSLTGGGTLTFPRHAEEYTFTLPSLLLGAPTAEECLLDFEGQCKVECFATGVRAVMKFKPWRDGYVKGEVTRLEGAGEVKVARIEGLWSSQIMAYGLEGATEGTMFDVNDYLPALPLTPAINLTHPGPQTAPRFWTSLIEAVLYTDRDEADRAGRGAAEMVDALPQALRDSLLFRIPEGAPAVKPGYEGEEAGAVARDKRPLPPACRLQRSMGRALRYQLQYLVQTVSQGALEDEASEMEAAAGALSARRSTAQG